MRILQISASYKPAYIYGGPTMSVAMLSEQLANAGCDVHVFATTANGASELDVMPNQTVTVDGVSVTYFKRITKDHSHLSPALLKAVWKKVKTYDVVHIHAWWNLVSVLSCVIAVLRGVPVIVSARGTLSPYSFKNKNRAIKLLIHNLLSKPVLKRCHIHATSQRESEAVGGIITPKSFTTIPNFVKLPARAPAAQRAVTGTVKLIFFSRIEEKKGLDLLISALPLIKTPFHLTIAGSGNEAYVNNLKQLAADHGVTDKITWAGFINEDKFVMLQKHDLFVLPSYDENFGNAVIESLSVGTPALISKEVGLADYVNEHRLGWLCATSATSVAEMIDQVATQPAERERIRQQAPGIIDTDFSAGNLVEKYIGLYTKISKRH